MSLREGGREGGLSHLQDPPVEAAAREASDPGPLPSLFSFGPLRPLPSQQGIGCAGPRPAGSWSRGAGHLCRGCPGRNTFRRHLEVVPTDLTVREPWHLQLCRVVLVLETEMH